jgi:hypothetical protein
MQACGTATLQLAKDSLYYEVSSDSTHPIRLQQFNNLHV